MVEAARRALVEQQRLVDARRPPGYDVHAVAEAQRLARIVGDQQHGAPGQELDGQLLQLRSEEHTSELQSH